MRPNVVDGWYANYYELSQDIGANGLRATIDGVAFLPPYDGWRLLAMVVTIDEDRLLRPHALRGFTLHISLIFEHELNDELLKAARRLGSRWRGAAVVIDVKRIGNGGAAILSEGDPLQDAEFCALHQAGHYWYKEPHVSL